MSKEEEPILAPETSGDLSGWEEIGPGVYARDILPEQRTIPRSTCLELEPPKEGATRTLLRITARKIRVP